VFNGSDNKKGLFNRDTKSCRNREWILQHQPDDTYHREGSSNIYAISTKGAAAVARSRALI